MNEQIREELLKSAENLAKEAIEAVFKVIEIYVHETGNKFDDAIIPFLPMAKAFVLDMAEKIDGE